MIFSGFLSAAEQSGQDSRFNFVNSIPALAHAGFPIHSQWRDNRLHIVKSGRDIQPVIWHQPPVCSEKYRLTIIADARLHDRSALALTLNLTGHEQNTDIDLILAAYRKWGTDCPKHMLGDYAFAIWDAANNMLFCARDHIGTKPFFYSQQGSEFAFSTDLNVILNAHRTGFDLDEDWMIAVLRDRRLIRAGQTFYLGVKSLPPGHSLTVNSDCNPQLRRYWYPENIPALRLNSDGEYAEALRDQIDIAVADCLTMPGAGAVDGYNGGFGVHVSGGLDSSAVTSLAIPRLLAQGKAKPEAFCWQPPPTQEDAQSPEHLWLNAMSEKEGLSLNYAKTDDDLIYQLCRQDGTRIPISGTYMIEADVQRQAEEKHIGVMLSGWGGDELCSHSGRTYHGWLFKTGRWRLLWSHLRAGQKGGTSFGTLRSFWAQGLVPQLPEALADWIHKKRNRPSAADQDSPQIATSLLQPGLKGGEQHPELSALATCAVRDMQVYLLNNGHITERIESWAYHGARRGLEYRYPLLDRRVIEFALSLPPEQYRKNGLKRFVFRNAMRGTLPDTIVDNLSKNEPVRAAFSSAAAKDALARLARELEAGELHAGRSEYIDMGKMLRIMGGETNERISKTNERIGATTHAISLLDIT